jgi:hypothetical protein
VKVRGIVTAVSEIYQHSAGRGLGKKERFDPRKMLKVKICTLARHYSGGPAGHLLAGLLTKLSKV